MKVFVIVLKTNKKFATKAITRTARTFYVFPTLAEAEHVVKTSFTKDYEIIEFDMLERGEPIA